MYGCDQAIRPATAAQMAASAEELRQLQQEAQHP